MDIDKSLDEIIKSTPKPTRGRGRGNGGGGRGTGGRASRGRGNATVGGGGGRGKGGRGTGGRATRGGGGGGRGTGGRATRGRGARAGKTVLSPPPAYTRGAMPQGKWGHDLFTGKASSRRQVHRGPQVTDLRSRLGDTPALTTGTKIRVSNLDSAVTGADMKELFETEGKLKKVVMTATHCDITFVSKKDAVAAAKKYNGVTLDGLAMKIALVKSGISADSGKKDVNFTVMF
eukprot:m.156994 g.156994  ORF g.156994 m.156994 type:complete len:232 (+) comp17957_c0_seq3:584-1279(+)